MLGSCVFVIQHVLCSPSHLWTIQSIFWYNLRLFVCLRIPMGVNVIEWLTLYYMYKCIPRLCVRISVLSLKMINRWRMCCGWQILIWWIYLLLSIQLTNYSSFLINWPTVSNQCNLEKYKQRCSHQNCETKFLSCTHCDLLVSLCQIIALPASLICRVYIIKSCQLLQVVLFLTVSVKRVIGRKSKAALPLIGC